MASTLVEFALRERAGRLLMIDPNIRPGLIDDSYRDRLNSLIRASTVVKASDRDLAWLYADLDYAAAAADLLAQGVSLVVVTLGADGAFGAHRDLWLRVAAPPVQVVDTIGAGDAFGAAILAWLHDHRLIGSSLVLSEDQLRSALDYACLVASITCARAGADPPWKRELIPT
jgi:fructokinase